MISGQYIFRMDDACPWMDLTRWNQMEAIFDRYDVRPVVAIVPDCQDPELRPSPMDSKFWAKARGWHDKGWDIALHGCTHVYAGKNRGLVPLNAQTEFAGLPEDVQREKIKNGWRLIQERGLEPTVWIAPGHTFDRITLKCLSQETSINIVSDGISNRPFRRFDFTWIPQQVWKPSLLPAGTWTVCLHPNSMTRDLMDRIDKFLSIYAARVTSIGALPEVTRQWGLADAAFESGYMTVRSAKRAAGDLLSRLKGKQ